MLVKVLFAVLCLGYGGYLIVPVGLRRRRYTLATTGGVLLVALGVEMLRRWYLAGPPG